MVRMMPNTGNPGPCSGRFAVCLCLRDIAPGALGRSLPIGGET
jgi:hypothetical protein